MSRNYMRNFIRQEQIFRSGQESGLPLFDQRPIEAKSAAEATIPAHRKSVRSLTDVQHAALDAVAARLGEQNLRVLMLLADNAPMSYHDIHAQTKLPVPSVVRCIHTLHRKLSLVTIAYTAPGPYGPEVAFYSIDQVGLQRMCAAHPGGAS